MYGHPHYCAIVEASLVCSPVTTRPSRRKQKCPTGIPLETANKLSRAKATLSIMLSSDTGPSEPLSVCIDHDSRFIAVYLSHRLGCLANAFTNLAVARTDTTTTMDIPPDETSGIRHAIKRLSSVLNRSGSTATTTLKRSKSKTFNNSISSLPNKDVVPQRSALRDSRLPGTQDRRVSFYDSLPCLDNGPKFEFEVPWSMESAERRDALLLPAITDDDDSADDNLREAEFVRDQSGKTPGDLEPVARHDSSLEPISNQRPRSVHQSRNPGSLAGNAERERSCMNFTRAVIEVNSRSQSRIRPLSLLADRTRSYPSLGATGQESSHAPASQEGHAQQSGPRTQKQTSKTEHLDNISQAYKAHVDRSLMSMQGHDKRGSAYVHDALVEIQEALEKALAETTTTESSSTDNDETDRARMAETSDSNASNDKTHDAFSFEMPYDSAQPSAEAVNFTKAAHLEAPAGLHDSGTYDWVDEDLEFDPALMPLPLRIPTRHPGRGSKVVQ